MYENKKIFIMGLAKSGFYVAKLIASHSKSNEIIATDLTDIDETSKEIFNNLNIKFIKSDSQIDLLDDSFDVLIKNPGILPSNEVIKKAESLGIDIVNEMEVAYHYLPKNITIIGVTGSNGKTTTTTIIYEILKRMGKSVVLGGNIGFPLSQVADTVHENDILLLEISDHQLLNFKDFKTNISVLTNVCPTHLDYHGSYEKYMWTKSKIFNLHTKDDLAVINELNNDSLTITENIPSKKLYFNGKNAYIKDNGLYVIDKLIIKCNEIMLKGIHNYENILAALLVINEFGIDIKIVKEFLKTFAGVEHRIEFVRDLNGVKYYNDSKSTNPTATITALKTFDEPIHLILGGLERYQDFNELNGYVKKTKCIYAIGEVSDRIKEYADKINVKCIKCYKLSVAIEKIRENITKGDVVLLSPASASQDQYKKFEDRGNEFKILVAKL
ncbi:MAG: UDP-N-acetylmuramoyl-L-alanine--D-glutamate ligase [Bacilli bacterium]